MSWSTELEWRHRREPPSPMRFIPSKEVDKQDGNVDEVEEQTTAGEVSGEQQE